MNSTRAPKKILIVKTHAMGDVLLTTPAIRALRHLYGSSTIHYLTGESAAAMLEGNPHIDKVLSIPDDLFFKRKIMRIVFLLSRLRSTRYDMLILFQSNRIIQQMFRLIKARTYAGFDRGESAHYLNVVAPWRPDRNQYVAADFLSLVNNLGSKSDDVRLEFNISKSDRDWAEEFGRIHGSNTRGLVVMAPGGGINSRDTVLQKVWPASRFRILLDRLHAQGYRVAVVGAESDRRTIASILDHPQCVDLVGRTPIGRLAALIAAARVTITNDSMPAHLAISQSAPVVILFGPSRWQSLLPPAGRYRVVAARSACAPCYDNEPFPGCDRMECIESISEEDVWEAIRAIVKP